MDLWLVQIKWVDGVTMVTDICSHDNAMMQLEDKTEIV